MSLRRAWDISLIAVLSASFADAKEISGVSTADTKAILFKNTDTTLPNALD